MKELMTEAVVDMVNDGIISLDRVQDLIYIKEFVDRISTRKYISEDTAIHLKEQYGVMPNIVTWGDYFQTELASSLAVIPDDEFKKVVDTIKFDMISSCTIFTSKETSFHEWIDSSCSVIKDKAEELFEEDDKDLLHLQILKNYYVDLGLVDNFTEAEIRWYSQFREAMAI